MSFIRFHSRVLLSLIVLLGVSPAMGESHTDPGSAKSVDTVRAFNEAISQRDGAAAIAQLAAGGAQFTLRELHDGIESEQLQTEITQHWKMISPVLFASTSDYSREVEILSDRTDGDISTVWTRTRTRSVRRNSSEPSLNDFTEVYLLVKTSSGWKIAVIADNRQATALAE